MFDHLVFNHFEICDEFIIKLIRDWATKAALKNFIALVVGSLYHESYRLLGDLLSLFFSLSLSDAKK